MAKWQCIKCGKETLGGSSTPSGKSGGKCPDTSSGNHIWKKIRD
jgi:hypothetical protein